MKRVTLLAALALLAGTTSVSAHQPAATTIATEEDGATGRLCNLAYVPDPTADDVQVGEIDAGPMAVLEDHDLLEVWCTVQVNQPTHQGYSHGQVVHWASGVGVVVMEPRLVSFVATAEDVIYLCVEIWIYADGHKTMFWHNEERYWSEDPAVPCAKVTIPPPITPGQPVPVTRSRSTT